MFSSATSFSGQRLSIPRESPHAHARQALPCPGRLRIPAAGTRAASENPALTATRETATGHQQTMEPPPPLLTREQALEQLNRRQHPNTATYKAFFSSVAGGITTDPAAMVVPMDDHMVHRGHAVFDTATISDGHLYELDEHLDRLLESAGKAKIKSHLSRNALRSAIVATAAASALEQGFLKYWLSSGPGGFSVSPSECPQSAFYVMAMAETLKDTTRGLRMITTTVPMKSPDMATAKSVNYLPNVLMHMEAEEAGVDEALWIDESGNIGEGPTMNVAFVSEDDYLLVPSFERILAGCTAKQVLKLANEHLVAQAPPNRGYAGVGVVGGGAVQPRPLLRGVRFAPVPEAEARKAKEMMLLGSGTKVAPVIEWDGNPVGTGSPGPVSLALRALLQEAYRTKSLVPIPKLY